MKSDDGGLHRFASGLKAYGVTFMEFPQESGKRKLRLGLVLQDTLCCRTSRIIGCSPHVCTKHPPGLTTIASNTTDSYTPGPPRLGLSSSSFLFGTICLSRNQRSVFLRIPVFWRVPPSVVVCVEWWQASATGSHKQHSPTGRRRRQEQRRGKKKAAHRLAKKGSTQPLLCRR